MRQTPNMALTTWDALNDFFSHSQLKANFDAIDAHDHSAGKGVAIAAGGLATASVGPTQLAPLAVTNAKMAPNSVSTTEVIDNTLVAGDVASAELDRLGLSGGGVVRRGKFNPGVLSESRTSATYGLMPTPDQVSNVVLPTDGLIAVAYQATWQESVNDAARAAIFIGTNQLKVAQEGSSSPFVTEVGCSTAAATDNVLATSSLGLSGATGSFATGYLGDVTTGQVVGDLGAGVGGPCWVFAAAGTYTVSVQFKSSSGSVTRKNPHLWVWTVGF